MLLMVLAINVGLEAQEFQCEASCANCTVEGFCLECDKVQNSAAGFDFNGFCRWCNTSPAPESWQGCAECVNDFRVCSSCGSGCNTLLGGRCYHCHGWSCPMYCTTCSPVNSNPFDMQCTKCYTNSGLIGKGCSKCQDPHCNDCRGDIHSCFKCFPQFGFASSENKTCLSCEDESCEECSGPKSCKSCLPGFGVDPLTHRCVPCQDVNCDYCGDDSAACRNCTGGYGKNAAGGTPPCLPCPAHCSPDGCATDSRVCTSCLRGFNLTTSGTCELMKRQSRCPPHAYSCDNTTDLRLSVCDGGFGRVG